MRFIVAGASRVDGSKTALMFAVYWIMDSGKVLRLAVHKRIARRQSPSIVNKINFTTSRTSGAKPNNARRVGTSHATNDSPNTVIIDQLPRSSEVALTTFII